MAKTSIDGLTVRSERKRRPPVVNPHQVVRDIRPVSKASRNHPATAELADVRADTIQQNSTRTSAQDTTSAQDDFLAAPQGFSSELERDAFGAMDEATWSELLDGFATEDATNKPSDLGLQRRNANSEPTEPQSGKPVRRTKAKAKRGANLPKKHHFKIKHPILLTIFIILVSLGVTGFVWGDSLISRLTNGQSGFWDTLGALVSNEVPFETDANGRTNVLVFGTEGYDMAGSSGDKVHDGAQLTDSIMVISFDQKTQDVALLSLPRDLKVPKACYVGKLNEVYTCHSNNGADDQAGAVALMQQLSEVLGIEFQYWAHVNWGSLVQIVDTIGGVTVVLDEDINDYNYTKTVIKAGEPTRLTGEQAVGLARARHGTMGGDFTRGNSQQKIVEGIAREITSNGLGISEALGLLNILGDNFRSNFSSDNVKAGVRLISTFNPSAIRNVALIDYMNNVYYMRTAMINGYSYVVPNEGEGNYQRIHELVAKMFNSNPAVREGSQIAIYNGTDTDGMAGAERTKLEADGYVVSGVGNTEAGTCTEKYCVYALTDDMPATLEALATRYGVNVHPAVELPADIAPGAANFVLIIGQKLN